VKSVTSLYGADVLNPLIISSVKNTCNYIHVSESHFFFILNISYTDRIWQLVYTVEITDGLNSVSNGDLKLPTELFRRRFRWY
jgi:hypothetical protein